MIDTHIHIDGEEFKEDLAEVVQRAKDAGCEMMFVPAINLESLTTVPEVCSQYPGFMFPMMGLHPEDVKEDWQEVLEKMRPLLTSPQGRNCRPDGSVLPPVGELEGAAYIAIGEVGLDYYWSREFEKEQLQAFEEQVKWSVEMQLPLMIHCRKAQNEMVKILRKYKDKLPGGVFHCFTGNAHEAEELLEFENFVLGIGGVLTFKKSNLPETLKEAVPLSRIVLETDAPYMAPVPMRGKRNESSYIIYIKEKLAEIYGTTADDVDRITTETAKRVFAKRLIP
ncbi:MAG: TatD family hydrolase [Bacteroidaceae bacterium]|nr:TatD family hydrolase [Bacteroidaceae bacterium]